MYIYIQGGENKKLIVDSLVKTHLRQLYGGTETHIKTSQTNRVPRDLSEI